MRHVQLDAAWGICVKVIRTPMYLLNVMTLWCTRKINMRTVVHALRNRPSAVAGRGGSYHVDPLDPNE